MQQKLSNSTSIELFRSRLALTAWSDTGSADTGLVPSAALPDFFLKYLVSSTILIKQIQL